jgi:hypothetical protein
MQVNVSGLLVDFYMGGQSWIDYTSGADPVSAPNMDTDEYELFRAVEEGRTIRGGFGGYYVRADLTPGGVRAARYWAETMATASQDNAASGDPDARNELRAAHKMLARLNGTR